MRIGTSRFAVAEIDQEPHLRLVVGGVQQANGLVALHLRAGPTTPAWIVAFGNSPAFKPERQLHFLSSRALCHLNMTVCCIQFAVEGPSMLMVLGQDGLPELQITNAEPGLRAVQVERPHASKRFTTQNHDLVDD
jgi:hypothetical protein